MDLDHLKDYLPYATNLDAETIKEEQLPGESKVLNGLWFFIYDEDKTQEIVKELFLGNVQEETEEIDANTINENEVKNN